METFAKRYREKSDDFTWKHNRWLIALTRMFNHMIKSVIVASTQTSQLSLIKAFKSKLKSTNKCFIRLCFGNFDYAKQI